jgi:hypothetical protein
VTASRVRLASAAAVAAWLAAARVLVPEAEPRAALHYAGVAALGYGHLLGATRAGRGALPRPSPGAPAPALRAWLALALVASFAPLYALAAAHWPALVVASLAVAVWHAVENDLTLPAALRAGGRLGPLPRSLRAQAPALALAALAALAAALELGGRVRLSFGDLFAAAILHHLVSWLLVVECGRRALAARDRAAARRLGRRLAALHAAPIAAAAAVAAAPDSAPARLLAPLLAPPLYLYFSAVHVAATALARGVGPRARAA